MRFKTEIRILIGTAILVLIVLLATSGNNSNNQTTEANQNITPTQQADDPMADMHRPRPVDSKIFDNLLGKQAPDFTLESYDGTKYTLSSLKGKNILLFFNEGLMCYPACWNQITAFGSDTQFNQKNTVALSITVDPKNEWKSAIDKMPELAKATVLFDSDRRVSSAYGVMTLTSSMHRGQFPGHTYILIDKKGIVRFTKDDETMAVRNQELAKEVDKL